MRLFAQLLKSYVYRKMYWHNENTFLLKVFPAALLQPSTSPSCNAVYFPVWRQLLAEDQTIPHSLPCLFIPIPLEWVANVHRNLHRQRFYATQYRRTCWCKGSAEYRVWAYALEAVPVGSCDFAVSTKSLFVRSTFIACRRQWPPGACVLETVLWVMAYSRGGVIQFRGPQVYQR